MFVWTRACTFILIAKYSTLNQGKILTINIKRFFCISIFVWDNMYVPEINEKKCWKIIYFWKLLYNWNYNSNRLGCFATCIKRTDCHIRNSFKPPDEFYNNKTTVVICHATIMAHVRLSNHDKIETLYSAYEKWHHTQTKLPMAGHYPF